MNILHNKLFSLFVRVYCDLLGQQVLSICPSDDAAAPLSCFCSNPNRKNPTMTAKRKPPAAKQTVSLFIAVRPQRSSHRRRAPRRKRWVHSAPPRQSGFCYLKCPLHLVPIFTFGINGSRRISVLHQFRNIRKKTH